MIFSHVQRLGSVDLVSHKEISISQQLFFMWSRLAGYISSGIITTNAKKQGSAITSIWCEHVNRGHSVPLAQCSHYVCSIMASFIMVHNGIVMGQAKWYHSETECKCVAAFVFCLMCLCFSLTLMFITFFIFFIQVRLLPTLSAYLPKDMLILAILTSLISNVLPYFV